MSLSPPNQPTKTDLRRALRARRNALPDAQCDAYSARIVEHLQSWLLSLDNSISTLALYEAMPREVDLSALLNLNFEFAMPRRVGENWVDADDENPFALVNVMQVLAPSQIDIFLIPGLGFDARGHRIGQGGGWYDRVLSRAPHAFKIGVVFDCQIVEHAPHEAHDMKMDGVVTESGLRFVVREND